MNNKMGSLGAHTHTFERVVRRKGKNVRYQCSDCYRIGPWVQFVNAEDVPEGEVYDDLTVQELRSLCKSRGLVGYSKKNRSQLLAALSGDAA